MPKQQNDTAARPRWNRLWRQRPTPRGSISPNKMNRAAPYLFLAPSLAGLCVFVLVPFADAVRRSFTDAMGSRFVGFANYASVLGNLSLIHILYSQMIAGRDAAAFGEAKNSWLTGTAAWTFVNISQYILGIQPTLDGLRIAPCIPAAMPGFTVTRTYRGAVYELSLIHI